MPRYIDADKTMEEIDRIGGHNLCEWETLGVKALIDRQPTADVVPKSEVEKFAEDIKLEFYREFDEIIPSIMADKIEELKKKYTEGEDKPASEEKYFSPEDVRKMTNQEVREKYTAIRKSMERW